MGDLDRLLSVQQHDTKLDQLRHRRRTLAERASVAAEQAAVDGLDAAIATTDEQQTTLARSQKRLDDEVALLVAKIKEVDRTLYGGTVSNRRELEALQAELGSLQRRQRSLEDEDLAIMERLEPVEAKLTELRDQRSARAVVLTRRQQELTVAEAEIDATIDQESTARAAAVDGVAAELVSEYETFRRAPGGIGVARLVGPRCDGCNLELSAVEVNRIRKLPAGEVAHCEECGRLLVVV